MDFLTLLDRTASSDQFADPHATDRHDIFARQHTPYTALHSANFFVAMTIDGVWIGVLSDDKEKKNLSFVRLTLRRDLLRYSK